jgi:hypothetical protein
MRFNRPPSTGRRARHAGARASRASGGRTRPATRRFAVVRIIVADRPSPVTYPAARVTRVLDARSMPRGQP